MSRTRSVAVALCLSGVLVLGACSDDKGAADPVEGGKSEVVGDADEGIDGVQAVRVYYTPPVHTEEPIPYELRPPAGGMHNPVPWSCGFFDTPVQDEHAVHTLEHGAVWLAYSPDLPPADLDALHAIARQNGKVLAAPYAELGEGDAVVATAWARQLRLESVDDPRLEQFVVQYQDGPQAPEAGVGCDGGLGEPIP